MADPNPAPPANNTLPQIEATDFAELRPWLSVDPASSSYSSYRQSRFRIDPDTQSTWLDLFERTIYRPDPATGQPRPEFAFARLMSEAVGHGKYLERMADRRNKAPVPTVDGFGPNFGDEDHLQMYWQIQWALTFFARDGLYLLKPPWEMMTRHNWQNFILNVYMDSFYQHCASVFRVERIQRRRLEGGFGNLSDAFRWVRSFNVSVQDAYESMVSAWTFAQNREQRQNVLALNAAMSDIPEMTKLLAVILEREKSFEDLLAREHFFGCLFDKRVDLMSSRTLSTLWDYVISVRNDDHDDNDDNDDPLRLYLDVYQHLEGLYRELTIYQQRLKELFDYRYLMDWAWNRLWDRMYVIINPDLGISEQTIDKFLNWTANNGHVAANLFGVHPARSGQFDGDSCSVCLCDFKDDQHVYGSVLVRTRCDHLFHPKCLFDAWDQPNFWQNRCPMCRTSAGRLRDTCNYMHTQVDHEYEQPGALQLDRVLYDTVKADFDNFNHLGPYDRRPRDVFWRRMIREQVLDPQRRDREANRPTWESILGGG